METATLQPPKTGKSRFSKALPAPPSFLKALKGLPASPQPEQSYLPPARKPLPTGNSSPLPPPPPLPPAKESVLSPVSPSNTIMTAKPLDSPLPPVPLNTIKSNAPLPSIPRRPVAAVSPSLTSPDDSPLSSLLSAYTDSNRSSDLTHLSYNDGLTSASSVRESIQPSPKLEDTSFTPNASSPRLDELFFTPLMISGDHDASREQERSRGPPKSADGNPKQLPHPPLKDFGRDSQRQPTAETSPLAGVSGLTTAAPRVVTPELTLAQSQQSQPQIWRRRSLKTEKNLVVTELKLSSSNGLTTSTSNVPPAEPALKEQSARLLERQIPTSIPSGATATSRSPLPTTPNAAFPGKNIRPAASRQQLVEDGTNSMGQEASRLKNTLKKANRGDTAGLTRQANPPSPGQRASPPSATTHSKTTSISSPVRLPTPEYDANDAKGPIVETIISPVSPASSPELPSEPRQQRPVPEVKDVRHVKSNSSFTSSSASTVTREPLHTLARKPSLQGFSARPSIGLPSSPAAGRSGQSQFPARSSSKVTSHAARSDNATATSSLVQKGRTLSEVGSSETIKASARPEQFSPGPQSQIVKEEAREEDDQTDHPGAARFPRAWCERAKPKDVFFQPPPITERHYRCLTQHRVMPETRNMYYPMACQACRVKDTAFRYVCSGCSIRICGSCRKTLGRFRGDLAALMRHNDAVIVEQSTEMEYDDEEATKQSVRAMAVSAAQQK